ncbi:MAG: response regulator [Lachnospiraceae bacterium]|jgi:signal transduction histidine kinase/CheY-like chemotaxis protein/HPt (histidine-containing phosphotransfer) domain-containing protein|nr:response regulator [Lachnospiraceae bacterium]
MKKVEERNELFQTSQMTILLSYTIFSGILTVESILLGWEMWAVMLILMGVGVCWFIHIQQRFNERYRVWIYSIFIMFTFFFYGSHPTSVFDTVAVMSIVLILFTMTGIRSLITFLQILYYITFGYGLVSMWHAGEKFDSLIITRALLHIAAITTISWISRTIISKWVQVLDHSRGEIEQLTYATQRLNDFLANVSHEIRTPINAIMGLTGICINNERDEEKLSNLISVRNAGRRVAEQISDILDYSEIDSNKLANNYEDYELSSVLNDLVTEIRPYKPEHIELVIDVDPAIPAVMNTDINKLKKILHHLIMNGLKYTSEGGVYARLSVEKQEYGVNLLLEVTDTGIGMDEEETERIMDGFYQADSGRTRHTGGLGLGLSITSGFVSALGGFMMVISKPGAGTTVRVSLPQTVVDPRSCMSLNNREELCIGAFLHFEKYKNPNVREYYNAMLGHIVVGLGVQMHRVDNVANLKKLTSSVKLTHLFVAAEEYMLASKELERLASDMVVVIVADSTFKLPRGSKLRVMEKPFYCFPVVSVLNTDATQSDNSEDVMYCNGIRALVVDDEPMNLSVAKSIFKRYGMVVSTAASGQDSIDMCHENEYDIIFMDHMMPGMDGVEAMKHIRSIRSGDNRDLPIVALTANAVSSAKEMFLSVGFDGFVSKPVEKQELERVLKKVLPKSAITYEKPEVVVDSSLSLEENEAENQDLSTYDKLNNFGIDTSLGLEYCQNDDELYEALLRQFVEEYPEKQNKIEGYYSEKDFKNYEIYVHALKTTAKMLGNIQLSEQAKDLEFAAKKEQATYIEGHHNALMSSYKSTMQYIADIYDIQADSKPAESSAEESDDEVLIFAPEKKEDDDVLIFEPVKE